MNPGTLLKSAFTGEGAWARVLGAGMLVATVAAQHPHPAFDRPRTRDVYSLVPNWKFFAPNPAVHDFHYVYRTLDQAGVTGDWQEIEMIEPRRLHQAFWFASRRPEKAVFDICTAVLQLAAKGGAGAAQTNSAYQVLLGFIRHTIRERHPEGTVQGFQFSVVRASGHDTSEDPEPLFLSPYTPLDRPAKTGHPTAA